MIIDLWRRMPGAYFCISTKSASGWKDNFFKRGDWDKVKQFLEDNTDKDCYFCVHGLSEKSRKKEFAVLPKMLWSDMDEVDPRDIKLKPTIAIESSPGRFVGLWKIDTTMSEKLNRRLTYTIGADPSGWDLGQVLRIPGTRNYKYMSTPVVNLLWADGPTYKASDLDRLLEAEAETNEKETLDRVEWYKKNERLFSVKLNRMIRDKGGDRSKVFWSLMNLAYEEGHPYETTVMICKVAASNKFKDRRDEDKCIRTQLDKVYFNHTANEKPVDSDYKNGYVFCAKPISAVEEREIDWLWRPYLARGEVTLLEGDPAIGKSHVMQVVSMAVVQGSKLPSPRSSRGEHIKKGKVLYFDIENSAGSVTRKRLKWNGCSTDGMTRFFQEEEPFTMDNEDAKIAVLKAIERHKPSLIVFDTLNLYIGKADIAKSNEATQALAIFKQIATQFNCAVVLIRHLTKSRQGKNAITAGQGNIAIIAQSRIALTVGFDPEDEDGSSKALCVSKLSFAPRPPGIRFHVESLPDTLRESDRCRLIWGDYDPALTADGLVSIEGKTTKDPTEKNKAIELAKDRIEEAGELPYKNLITMAESSNISSRSMDRALRKLKDEGTVKTVKKFGGEMTYIWVEKSLGEKHTE